MLYQIRSTIPFTWWPFPLYTSLLLSLPLPLPNTVQVKLSEGIIFGPLGWIHLTPVIQIIQGCRSFLYSIDHIYLSRYFRSTNQTTEASTKLTCRLMKTECPPDDMGNSTSTRLWCTIQTYQSYVHQWSQCTLLIQKKIKLNCANVISLIIMMKQVTN